jgi:hypothetical protein
MARRFRAAGIGHGTWLAVAGDVVDNAAMPASRITVDFAC